MDQEDELIFKRFPANKQEQVRGLVAYARLMGLDGKDLVSIGGKLARMAVTERRKANLEIIKNMKCAPIGKDRDSESMLDERFKLKTDHGSYNFENGYRGWTVTSLSTKVQVTHKINDAYEHEMGRVHWQRRHRYAMLLDIATGVFPLNF
jgi:hypothetical protein